MRFSRADHDATLAQLVAVLVAVCLLVRPQIVTLHLCHHEHTGSLGATIGHDAPGHDHPHQHHPHQHQDGSGEDARDVPGRGERAPDHPPHPASDHCDLAKVRATAGSPQPPERRLMSSAWNPLVVLAVEASTARARRATGPPRPDLRAERRTTTVLLL